MAILLHLLTPEARAHRLRYYTSGDVTGDFANSVSYLTVGFHAAQPLSATTVGLPANEMDQLLRLAQRAIQRAVTEGRPQLDVEDVVRGETLPPHFAEPSGAFVTLKRDDRLRGCIGHIFPHRPLYAAVIENAVSAALHDGRFPPVTSAELPSLDLEVSVLSRPRPIPSYEAFEIGRHGIVLRKSGRRAVYLPEVAVEQRWDVAQTLTRLSMKAGLSADAWREGAAFEVFTTQTAHTHWRR